MTDKRLETAVRNAIEIEAVRHLPPLNELEKQAAFRKIMKLIQSGNAHDYSFGVGLSGYLSRAVAFTKTHHV